MRGRYPWWGDSVGGTPLHRPARSRSDPHQVPTMGTASGCGTTVWWYRPGIQVTPSLRRTGERTACPVLETGSPSTPLRDRHPWSPLPRLTGEKTSPRATMRGRYPWWGDRVGGTPLHRPARSRSDPHQVPTMGTASGCGTTVWWYRPGIQVAPYLRLTGERTACPVLETGSPRTPMRDRHPWSLPSLVLPVKKRHPAPRCGAGTHGGVVQARNPSGPLPSSYRRKNSLPRA